MIETGHHESCVCSHCSAIREECPWPKQRNEHGHFVAGPPRFGHDWRAVRGTVMECHNCHARGRWGIQRLHSEGKDLEIAVVVPA